GHLRMAEFDGGRASGSILSGEANGGRHRPEVLYVTHHLPWPQHSGGRIREAQLLSRLAHRFTIEVIAVSKTPDRDCAAVNLAREAGVEPRLFAATPGPWLAGPLAHRHGSKAASNYIARKLQSSPAVVHVEGHYLFHLLPEFARRRAIVVEHNVESTLLSQAAETTRSLGGRATLFGQALRTRRTERAVWRMARFLGAITDEDADTIGCCAPHADIRLLPNGCDHIERAVRPNGSASGSHLLLVGNFSYGPNLDAARVMATGIFPAVVSQHPDARLTVVGADPPAWLVRAASADCRITVAGWVSNLTACLDSADVVVCPLRIGGGVKVKILEALQRGKAIVTTPVGAQGLPRTRDCPVVVCEAPAALAHACVRLLACPEARREQERRALAAASSLPTWDEAADALANCWTALTETTVSAGGRAPRRTGRAE
ncbi:MAG: glycosyltransferase, partial [Sciscionella sp.]